MGGGLGCMRGFKIRTHTRLSTITDALVSKHSQKFLSYLHLRHCLPPHTYTKGVAGQWICCQKTQSYNSAPVNKVRLDKSIGCNSTRDGGRVRLWVPPRRGTMWPNECLMMSGWWNNAARASPRCLKKSLLPDPPTRTQS